MPTLAVVDDDATFLEMVQLALQIEGYEILPFYDGEAAWRHLSDPSSAKPDALVLDIMMPRLDGNALAKRMEADPRTRDIPIIVLTAKGRYGDKFEPPKAAAVLQKPCGVERLRETIREVVQKAARRPS
ncbi:MAG: response regulator [Elusimicrobia bacterium]|nr:response regulator [Elusimicrobiota bacterium]